MQNQPSPPEEEITGAEMTLFSKYTKIAEHLNMGRYPTHLSYFYVISEHAIMLMVSVQLYLNSVGPHCCWLAL